MTRWHGGLRSASFSSLRARRSADTPCRRGADGLYFGASRYHLRPDSDAKHARRHIRSLRPDGLGYKPQYRGHRGLRLGGDADRTNANVTLKGHLGVVTSNSATASATATLSDGAAHAGGDALVKVMASATDSGEIGPVLNYSDANGGSYYEANFETHLNRLQFSFAKNGALTYPARRTASPQSHKPSTGFGCMSAERESRR